MKKITFILLFFVGFFVDAQTITHSTSLTLGTTNVACNGGTPSTSRDNRYYRFFNLSGFSITAAYNVSSVQVGIQTLDIPTLPTGFPLIVKIFSTTATNFPTGFPTGYTELASVTTNILATDVGTLKSIPIVATIPANSNLLVEVGYAAPLANSGNRIFLSANDLGQTAPSYISSTTCAIVPPTDMATIGFATAHLVLTVTGSTLGINENSLEKMVSISPNPSKGLFSIDLNSSIIIEKASLTDITGKQIAISLNTNNSFDITNLNSGIYILNLQTSEGVLNKRIIKE